MAKNLFNQKLSKLWGKMDSKILNSKINKSIEILQNTDTRELEKQLSKIDPNELLEKINVPEEKEIADVENKCGKAKNSMDKAREIVFGGSQPEFKPSYVSREDRLKLGDNY